MKRCALLLVLMALPALAAEIPLSERRSGYALMSRPTQAMQDDDSANPGMLWVLEGESLWAHGPGTGAPACAGCHGDARVSMKGVAVRYPRFDAETAGLLDLEQRINRCRSRHQQAPAFAFESRPLLAITALIARQSRGLPIEVDADGRSAPFLAAGREQFERRRGQLNLACRQCHDDNWGRHLAGSVVPQAHPTGYPIYRLQWQGMGSLQRRLRACMSALRSEPYEYGAPELVNLEFFLMWRARGMPSDAPAVRP